MSVEITKENLLLDEAIAKGWELPEFTVKEIRDAIPAHCFQRDTFRSLTYVLHDILFVGLLVYAASHIDALPISAVFRFGLWVAYWFSQSVVGTGLWVIGHECGHQAFSPSKAINDGTGKIIHSFLLVPYFSLKFTHSKHHKRNGHLSEEVAFIPKTRSSSGLPPLNEDIQVEGPHSAFEETPFASLFSLFNIIAFGWIMYLMVDASGPPRKEGWVSHFNPFCSLFNEHQFWEVIESIAYIGIMVAVLVYAGQLFGSIAVIKYYTIPYLFINGCIVIITYLQHTSPRLPHYSDKVWNFQRGAVLTVDRSYGFLLNHFHHHTSDAHVAHHLFSRIPHYHTQEATHHIKKALGKHYCYDSTPIPQALYNTWRSCKFVEDEGDVRFFKN
ncbi:delta-12-fatty acid desaturase [Spinellus fusiger]|nr:delta-12-fatty acid desaturase [Spinellus fusiger]